MLASRLTTVGVAINPCTHTHEPGCAVKAARDAGTVAASRYESYVGVLADINQRARRKPW